MIVVTGATGNIGRPLTRALAEAGQEVTAVSRHTATVPDGVRHVVADLAQPASLTPALTGAKALFLLLSGDLHSPDSNPADIIRAADTAGVRRIVLLSTQGVSTRPFGPTRIAMRALEDVLRNSTLEWTILRPGGFASNALWWSESVRTQRVVAAPFGDVGVPIIDPTDIAEVAAAGLLTDQHTGATYELTGPEVITPAPRRTPSPPPWAPRSTSTTSPEPRPSPPCPRRCPQNSPKTPSPSSAPRRRRNCVSARMWSGFWDERRVRSLSGRGGMLRRFGERGLDLTDGGPSGTPTVRVPGSSPRLDPVDACIDPAEEAAALSRRYAENYSPLGMWSVQLGSYVAAGGRQGRLQPARTPRSVIWGFVAGLG